MKFPTYLTVPVKLTMKVLGQIVSCGIHLNAGTSICLKKLDKKHS